MSLITLSGFPSAFRQLACFVLIPVFTATLVAQGKPNKSERREMKREMLADSTGGKVSKRDDAIDSLPGKPDKRDSSGSVSGGRGDTSDPQARMLGKLREQLAVTDDAEWDVIAERIAAVSDARRSLGGSSTGGRGNSVVPDKDKRTGRSSHPEQDALRAAVQENMPDAEIKMRLARVHDVHRQDEARLTKAQEELRSVLSVRQEAVAVMAGLLPP